MKKLIHFSHLIFALMLSGFTTTLMAQDVSEEMKTFVQQFQDAYNKEDHNALRQLYTADAKSPGSQGAVLTGQDAIAAYWEARFKGTDAVLTLQQDRTDWSDLNHAYVAKGTYKLVGVTAKGDKVDISGKYANTMVKTDGAWKIAEATLPE